MKALRYVVSTLSLSILSIFAGLNLTGCNPNPGVEFGVQVITPSNIYEPVTAETVNVVWVDGQSNAINVRLHDAIILELTALTGRETRLITCAVKATNLQTHQRGHKFYKYCADKRLSVLADKKNRLVGIILMQGEANIHEDPYIWSDLFKQYKDEMRTDTEYLSMPIVFSQLPNPSNTDLIPGLTPERVEIFMDNQQLLGEELYGDNVRMIVTEPFPLHDEIHFAYSELPKVAKLAVDNLYELMLIEQSNGVAP